MKKIALLSSTNGSVARAVMMHTDYRFHLIITDRNCGANHLALEFKIPNLIIEDKNNLKFSDRLDDELKKHEIDYVLIFFTRMLCGKVLKSYANQLINFHPALLPEFPGLHGFENSQNDNNGVIGSTVHLIDQGMDTGPQIIRFYENIGNKITDNARHIVFSQQVASLNEILNRIEHSDHQYVFHKSVLFKETMSGDSINLYEKIKTLGA